MKKIALINDLSGFGRCSLVAAIPVISVMGIQACPLPTAILTAQTGFDNYYCDDFSDRMNEFTQHWKEMKECFDGIYSGFMASASQIEKVIGFLDEFQAEDSIYLADPVMGDHGKPYPIFTPQFLVEMKELVRRADVITPNLTELCMLADVDYEELTSHQDEGNYVNRVTTICHTFLEQLCEGQTHGTKVHSVIVTGIIREKDGEEWIGNLSVSEDDAFYTENPYTGKGFSGTGDLFASVVIGSLVQGKSLKQATAKATEFLEDAIREASEDDLPPVHGVYFEKYLSRLL